MDEQARSHLEAAVAAQRQGQRALARRHWEAVLNTAVDHPVALNALGADALMDEDVARAIAFFRRATAADPMSPQLWANLARAQNGNGDMAGE